MTNKNENKGSLEAICPFCERKARKTLYFAVPKNLHDCKCGATAEIRLIKKIPGAVIWKLEWEW